MSLDLAIFNFGSCARYIEIWIGVVKCSYDERESVSYSLRVFVTGTRYLAPKIRSSYFLLIRMIYGRNIRTNYCSI